MAFIEQAMRLLREVWSGEHGPQRLAEEIACILSDWDKGGLDSPLKITSKSNETPIQIQQRPGEIPPYIMEFNFADGSQTRMTNDGTMQSVDPDGNIESAEAAEVTQASGGGTGLLGVIASGSGSLYEVTLQGSGTTVSATHPQIDEGEEIPAGRYVSVFQIGEVYYILEPTWLEEE